MITTLSSKGQAVIPEAIRKQARLRQGDKLDVGFVNGLVILRKQTPLSPAEVRSLLLAGRKLPDPTPETEAEVAAAVAATRTRRKRSA